METKKILKKMFSAIDEAETLTFRLKQTERLRKGGSSKAELAFTVQVSPLKAHVKLIKPRPANALFYEEGKNRGNVVVNPGRFLPNLKFAPTSATLMKDQHHPITEVGFVPFKKVLKAGWKKAKKKGLQKDVFKIVGEEKFDGKACYVLEVVDADFAYESYVVQGEKSLYEIAKPRHLVEYLIYENNKQLKDYFDIKEGQTIKIPTSFAKKATLCIDKKSYLPLSVKTEDEKGVFEEYHFLDLAVNVKLKDRDFKI